MNLHDSQNEFKEAITATAQEFKVTETIIEKDYWVTYILKRISESDYKNNIVFKGGTSLSKAYKLIERFSEDIDLALLCPVGDSNSKKERLLKKLAKEITTGFNEVDIPGVTSKHGRFRRTAHEYPNLIERKEDSVIKDKIIIELNSFTKPEPNNEMNICTMICNFLSKKDNDELIEKYELNPFPIKVLNANRTLTEKILGIIRLSFNENYVTELSGKIRHFYDVTIMLKNQDLEKFFNSDEFLKMIDKVKEDDKDNKEFNGNWMEQKWSDSILFSDKEKVWNELRRSYNVELKELVYGIFPNENEIKDTVKVIGNRLKQIKL